MVLDAIDKPGPSTASFSFPPFLPPSPRKKVSELEFVRTIVHQYVRFDRKTKRLNVSIPNLVSKSTNEHYLAKQSQARCKFCQKNCRLICNACNVRLHL